MMTSTSRRQNFVAPSSTKAGHKIRVGAIGAALTLVVSLIAATTLASAGQRDGTSDGDGEQEASQQDSNGEDGGTLVVQPQGNRNGNDRDGRDRGRGGDGDRGDDDDEGGDDDIDFLDGRSLDGSENNEENPTWGMAGTVYSRTSEPAYADGVSEMGTPAANPRYISNRIYNDKAINVFSENDVTHWGFVWGQFVDHTIGLRVGGEESADIPFDAEDPLEDFQNDLGVLAFSRSEAAPGTGQDSPREQVNTIGSYIDGFAVYGGDDSRLDWLRVGPIDGDPTNNEASLLNEDGYLPTINAREDAESAPFTELFGPQMLDPSAAVVAGDSRVNENLGLAATHTLFLREHNRIVSLLPDDLSEEEKFEIARRVVGATQQYITYEEYLPAFGIDLGDYDGYDPTVDATISNEFATVGFRAHSFIHGEFEVGGSLADYSEEQLAAFEAAGIELEIEGDEIEFAIPLNVAFGSPELLPELGLGTMLSGLSGEPQYANEELIDDQLRSVLFQIPSPEAEDPAACLDGELLPDCYTSVQDLGVLDLMRAHDHGIGSYNELRVAYGLDPIATFAEVTGEETEEFPTDDPEIDAEDPLNDPSILDFTAFYDGDGNVLDPEAVENGDVLAVDFDRRTTLAARLNAIYGSVDELDAFTGMMSEPHLPGTEFGELQLAIWVQQFAALRDGDRFFYLNDPVLDDIEEEFGIDYRQTLATVVINNTNLDAQDIPANVFFAPEDEE